MSNAFIHVEVDTKDIDEIYVTFKNDEKLLRTDNLLKDVLKQINILSSHTNKCTKYYIKQYNYKKDSQLHQCLFSGIDVINNELNQPNKNIDIDELSKEICKDEE